MQRYVPIVQETGMPVITELLELSQLFGDTALHNPDHAHLHEPFRNHQDKKDDDDAYLFGFSHPHSVVLFPVFEELGGAGGSKDNTVRGVILAFLSWDFYFQNLVT